MAGSWETEETRHGQIEGSLNTPYGVARSFTADASDGSVPDEVIESLGGSIMCLAVAFDGTTPPNSCTVSLVDEDGITIATTGAITASGRTYFDDGLIPVAGNVTITVSGNTTNSAKATVTTYVV